MGPAHTGTSFSSSCTAQSNFSWVVQLARDELTASVSELSAIVHLAVSRGWMSWGEPLVEVEPVADFPSDHAVYGVAGT